MCFDFRISDVCIVSWLSIRPSDTGLPLYLFFYLPFYFLISYHFTSVPLRKWKIIPLNFFLQVSLRQYKNGQFRHKCGAALLTHEWIVTAAHCVKDVTASNLLVRIGEYNILVKIISLLNSEFTNDLTQNFIYFCIF